MVTGIYQYIDGSLSNTDSISSSPVDPIATGLLLSGDEYCSSALVSLNLTDPHENIVNTMDEVTGIEFNICS